MICKVERLKKREEKIYKRWRMGERQLEKH